MVSSLFIGHGVEQCLNTNVYMFVQNLTCKTEVAELARNVTQLHKHNGGLSQRQLSFVYC